MIIGLHSYIRTVKSKISIIISLVMFCLALPVKAKTITLSAIDYPPHYGQSLVHNGPIIELIVSIYQYQGYEVEIVFLPWGRALEWTKQGKVDGIVGIWHNQEREKFLYYSAPIYPNEMVFYKRKGQSIEFNDYKGLKEQNLVLGSTRGYAQVKGIEESGIKISYVNNDIQNFNLLAKSRIDLIVVDKDYAKYILTTPELEVAASAIEPIPKILESRYQFLAISKNTTQAMKKLEGFNSGLKAFKQNGQFEAILSKHGID